MIAIVRIALQRPLTFIVMAIVIALAGVIAIVKMPVDIFPGIRIPVIAVAWQYAGLSPEDMAGRIVAVHERSLSTQVNDVEHFESQSFQGFGIIKIFFQPGVDIRTASAQVTASSQSILRQLPPGISPPLIVNYNASTVPIIQIALSGKGLSEQQLYDLGNNQLRPQLATVQGSAIPFPFGGRSRQIQVDLNPVALQSKGLSAVDVANALATQSQINPAGFAKIGTLQYAVRLNNAPSSVAELNDLPVKVVNGATIYMRDVAFVRDGSAPQTNIVHVDGRRSALMSILKNGSTSTLAIVAGIKEKLPKTLVGLDANLKALPIGDQSVFVKAAVQGVVKEGAIAAGLTCVLIFLFLGSWQSTLIVALSIPLAILGSIALLAATGQTLNIMTLGGLALAVGILVDEATVTIENINWHLEQGKDVVPAILDGAAQIATPAFVSLLCICIVFVPMFFLPGLAGYLFVPLALAVIFAMVISFLLSRTLVPTMAMYLLKRHAPGEDVHVSPQFGAIGRVQRGFERRFVAIQGRYLALLDGLMRDRRRFVGWFLAAVALSFVLVPFLGRNMFPTVDAGQIAIHVRAPIGSRVEDTAVQVGRIQQRLRQIIPPRELRTVVDNIGMPVSSLNLIYNNNGTIGSQDADILISLNEDHRPTADYIATLRRELPRSFPGISFAFLPADITSQILNFGSPAPIDIQVGGRKLPDNAAHAARILRAIRTIPGLADARVNETARYPQIKVNVDRSRIGQYGLTERDVTTSISTSLAGTSVSAPAFFLNPENGVQYSVVAQTPEYLVGSMSDLGALPVSGTGAAVQTLGGISKMTRSNTFPVVSRYDIQPVINIYATTQGRDLGAVAGDVKRVIDALDKQRPKGVSVELHGQYETMTGAYSGLVLGLAGAIFLIYLLIVVNFQSWIDPFVIVAALLPALAGIVWMLFLTATPLSVPALTGAIMCMGVATANSVLVVSFARERLAEHGDAITAAMEAGRVRFRPVLMTALAMIIGMLPMALGLGDGGEQNAPLGRAVIGGLAFATVATLCFVPVVFSLVHSRDRGRLRTQAGEIVHVA